MYDIISLILILLALYLVLHKNFNLGIMIFVVAVIFFVLFKRGEHFRSSLDIYIIQVILLVLKIKLECYQYIKI